MSDGHNEAKIAQVNARPLRPKFPELCMDLAFSIARRSTCVRLQVGCVIVTPDYRKVLAWGYNGNATGLPNQCDTATVGACGDLHAEENAVINCDVPRTTDKHVFCTHLPCVMCAKRLINLGGVHRLYYRNEYRIRDSIGLLEKVGIMVIHYPANGLMTQVPKTLLVPEGEESSK